MKKKQPRVQVARDGKILAEYASLQLASLLETGVLKPGDQCFDVDTQSWRPISEFIQDIPGFARRLAGDSPVAKTDDDDAPTPTGGPVPWILALVFLAAAVGAGLLAWSQYLEAASLQTRLAAATKEKSELQKQFDQSQFEARGGVAKDTIQGQAIVRDTSGKRVVLPGIKVRLFPRKVIDAHLEARQAALTPESGTTASQLASHFMKNLPAPVDSTTTDSDGRFELKVPEPGGYVLQTSLISAKTREMRLWFVGFDSRDPLNTPVNINDSNGVREYSPLLMVVEGR